MSSRMFPSTPVKSLLKAAAIAAMLGTSLSMANALNLDQAKNQGMVCELPTGYLQATGTATPDVRKMIDDINKKRRAEYKRIAEQHGVTPEQVGKLTAQKLQPKCK